MSADLKKRLFDLRLRRNDARKANLAEVENENKTEKSDKSASLETRKRKALWEESEEKRREECKTAGVDADREAWAQMGADTADKINKKKHEKQQRATTGFDDFEGCTQRQYDKAVNKLKPDFERYNSLKAKVGEDKFYAGIDTLGIHEPQDTNAAIDRLADEMNRQSDQRKKYSRRRGFDPDADIDYINERNRHFNKKLERFYGEYTIEIKQNLERGTAL